MTRVRAQLGLLLLLLLSTAGRADTPVNGRIDSIGTVKVLRVFGTPQEMGHAHGFLLADEIGSYLNACAKVFFGDDPRKYAEAIAITNNLVELAPATRVELEAILKGMKDAKRELPRLSATGREVRLEDLILLNTLDAIRAFGCSGFTVWGDAAGEAGLITARNFDFAIVDAKAPTGRILVRSPKGRHAVASIVPPGYIGSFTGISDQGVCTFMHDGDGPRSQAPRQRIRPVALIMTELLESTDATSALAWSQERLKSITPYPFSYMVRVVAPRAGSSKPARVFRVDASGLSENPAEDDRCLTTNHYLPLAEEPTSQWSQTRYDRLAEVIVQPVTSELAWKALAAVAADRPENLTLHSLVVFPEKRRLEIAFASVGDKLTPAPANPPVAITFDELFATAPGLP